MVWSKKEEEEMGREDEEGEVTVSEEGFGSSIQVEFALNRFLVAHVK